MAREEYWGTFSIFDHRDKVFRRALVLFDRVVMPVPDRPMYDITEQELDELSADVEYLVKNDAAVSYSWNSSSFQDWQANVIREALTVGPRDSLFDSRMLLQQRASDLKPPDVEEVIAVPVYGARSVYDNSKTEFTTPHQCLMFELAQYLSVPCTDVPLQDLIALRQKPAFRSALEAMRKWEDRVLPEVLSDKSPKKITAAANDFARMLGRYEEAMSEARFNKQKACVVSLLAVTAGVAAAVAGGPAIALLSAAAPALYALKDADKPSWKDVRDKDFAPAGVIYEANQVLDRYR
jgi:hypothetical protein